MKKAKKNSIVSFLLSEEHKTIPISELFSILTAKNIKYKPLLSKFPLVRVKVSENPVMVCKVVTKRASMLKLIIQELLFLETFSLNDFDEALRKLDLSFLQNKSFYVRIIKKGKNDRVQLKSAEIEAFAGARILQKTNSKVRFKTPDYILYGILCDNAFSFGILLKELKRGIFLKRSPRKRPFFMSSALDVYTARAMVNLAGIPSGSILDPFAGTCGILIEAGMMGYDVMGIDVKKYISKGCLRNLVEYIRGEKSMGIIQGDALKLPLRDNSIEAIVTDPPYGRSSTTLGRTIADIYGQFLPEARRVLKNRGKLVMLYPHRLSDHVEKKIKQLFRIEGKHLIRVHKNFLRVLVVAKKEV